MANLASDHDDHGDHDHDGTERGRLLALPSRPSAVIRHRHALLAGLVAAVLVAGVGIAIDVTRHPAPKAPPLVVLAPVTKGRVLEAAQASGRLVATHVTLVAPSVPGRLTHLLVGIGEHVKKGQILARLDPIALRADLARAEARAVSAEVAALEAELAYARSGGRGLPPGELDEEGDPDDARVAAARAARAAADVAASEASYQVARRRLAEGVVRAPSAGLVLERNGQEGEFLPAGAPLFRLGADPQELALEAALPEAASAGIEPGFSVEFRVPALPGRTFTGRVQRILPITGPASARHLPLVIALADNDPALRAGMSATVTVNRPSARGVLRVPRAALLFTPMGAELEAEAPSVWLAEADQQLRQVPVEVGLTDGGFAEVRAAGLREGAGVAIGYARLR